MTTNIQTPNIESRVNDKPIKAFDFTQALQIVSVNKTTIVTQLGVWRQMLYIVQYKNNQTYKSVFRYL